MGEPPFGRGRQHLAGPHRRLRVMSAPPWSISLDNEAVQALPDAGHRKHRAVLAYIEVRKQRQCRRARLDVLVPVAVRVEAGGDRTASTAAA